MIRRATTLWGLALLLWACARCASAQAPELAADHSGIHVYVLTFGPGDDAWEKWGHNAIRIVDDNKQIDIAVNWGIFDFSNKLNYAGQFVQGKLIYSMGSDPGAGVIDYYEHNLNRTVYQQELNLSLEQKIRLWNVLADALHDPKQRNYRYDYFLDNCSSRVRDVIDNLADHRLRAITDGKPSGTTYRFHTDRCDAEAPWLYVLLQGALGHPVDQPLDRWQEMFLPEKIHDRLNEVTVNVNGYEMPLVASDQVLYKSTRAPQPARPPVMWPWLFAVGVLFGSALAGLSQLVRRHWAARWGFTILCVPWLLLMSFGGTLLMWAWAATDHIVCRNNENVMQVSVLAWPLLVLMPMLAFGKMRRAILARRVAITMVGIAVLGMALKIFPAFYQVNWPIIALCLPVNAAIAYSAWVMSKPKLVAQPAKGGRGIPTSK